MTEELMSADEARKLIDEMQDEKGRTVRKQVFKVVMAAITDGKDKQFRRGEWGLDKNQL